MPGPLKSMLLAVLLWLTIAVAGGAQDTAQQPQGSATGTQTPSSTPPPGPGTPPQTAQSPDTSQGGQVTAPQEGVANTPDTSPLAGAEAITASLPISGRSFILPSFSIWEGGDTNARLVPGITQLEVAAIPVGSLDLHYIGQHNDFNLTYGGGAIVYETAWNESAAFDDVLISDQYTARRWNFLISDRASYLPQASLGFGGIGFAGVFNNTQSLGLGSSSGLNPAYSPEQSVLTGQAGAISETGVAQLQYFLTPRTSVSATGIVGYQYYSQSGLLSGNDRYGVLSIDHQITPTETVSFSYSVTEFRYNGGTLAVSDNLWRVGYGHRVTNHVALSLLAGPELRYSAIRGVFGERKSVSWSGQGALSYHGQRGSVTLSYLHYLTPGSGVFQGAQTSVASVALDRELSRTWTGDVSIGWSNNRALSTYSLNPALSIAGSINGEYGNVRLSHQVGRSMRLFAVYELERQESGVPIVAGSSSGLLVRQIFGVGLQWHSRPFGL